MLSLELKKEDIEKIKDPEWILVYSTIEDLKQENLDLLVDSFPNTPIFGTTSFNGVFTPNGFKKGSFILVGEKQDGIKAVAVMKEANEINAYDLALQSANEIKEQFGEFPDTILFHPTPGFEEKILSGLDKVFDSKVPIYGGSAADNTIEGDWKIHNQKSIINNGFLVIGFISENNKIYGSFSSGYLPTKNKGIVTKASGRTIFEIDNKPATEVYNQWTSGIISKFLETGGVVLSDTTLNPLGKKLIVKNNQNEYLVSHPHKVNSKEKSISFFTSFDENDEITLMFSTEQSLLKRVEQTLEKTLIENKVTLMGGLLIYCGGCVATISDKINELSNNFIKNTNNIPFLGIATFGEQGCFKSENYISNLHGNLMCCIVLF